MTRLFLAALSVGFLASPAVAQSESPEWILDQQRAVSDYLRSYEPQTVPSGSAAIRAYLDGAEAHWLANGGIEETVSARLTPYAAFAAVNGLYRFRGVEAGPDGWCDVYVEGVVPSFLAAVERSRLDAAALDVLFHVPSMDTTVDYFPVACDMPRETWSRVYRAVGELPALGRRAAGLPSFADSARAATLQRALRYAEQSLPLMRARNAIEHDSLDVAGEELRASIDRPDSPALILALGDRLWRAHAGRGESDSAFETLDALARNLSSTALPPDTLAAWYQTVDAERGPARFAASQQSAPAALVASDLRPDLGGDYTDLLTGDLVDLSDRDDALLLVDVWATWCVPCIAEVPVLKAFAARHGDRVRLVSVNADAVTIDGPATEVRAFMDRHGIDYPVLYDEPDRSLAERLDVRGYPAKYLVAADGSLLIPPGSPSPVVQLEDVDAYLQGLD